MKVIYDIGKIKRRFVNPILAIGIFDGVHLGHRYLINQVVKKAQSQRGTSVVMTFFPHPENVLRPRREVSFLATLEERLKLIEGLGVDVCIVIHFTPQFSKISAQYFVENYLLKAIAPKEIFVGSNFRFGKGRQGTTAFLKKKGSIYNFEVNVVAPLKVDGFAVSSTRIRTLIEHGKIDEASRLLGRRVSVSGKVVYGDRRGRILGFPTANLKLLNQCLPPLGVYLSEITYNQKLWQGIVNVGKRPSFHESGGINVEAHILDFSKKIYGKAIEVKFIKKLRNEKKFSSPEKLVEQIQKDKKRTIFLFQHPPLLHTT